MVAVAAPLLAVSQGHESETYYFVVDLDNTKGASLGLAIAARPDGFLVQEIADRDGTGIDTLIGTWNAASRATYPRAMVQTGDVIVRVNHEGVSAIPGALCCEGLRTQQFRVASQT